MSHDSSDKLRFLPLGLDVRNKPCLVVGGGSVGTRKVFNLMRAGAAVTIVSPTVTPEVKAQADAGQVRWVKDSFQDHQLRDTFLVIAATDDVALNARIVRSAKQLGTLTCDASSADRSEVIFAALHVENDVTVAVFTDGRDPAKARRTRDQIARSMVEKNKPTHEP